MMKPAEPTTLRTEAVRWKWSEAIAADFFLRSWEDESFKSLKEAGLVLLCKPLTTSATGRVPRVVTVYVPFLSFFQTAEVLAMTPDLAATTFWRL